MKRILIGLVLMCVLFAQVVYGADISTTWGWQQDLAQPVASWDVFRSTTASGPWTLVKNQTFYALVPPATEYQTTSLVTVPDNALTVVYYMAQTIGTSGIRSVNSTVISKSYDTRVAPATPTGFRVVTP